MFTSRPAIRPDVWLMWQTVMSERAFLTGISLTYWQWAFLILGYLFIRSLSSQMSLHDIASGSFALLTANTYPELLSAKPAQVAEAITKAWSSDMALTAADNEAAASQIVTRVFIVGCNQTIQCNDCRLHIHQYFILCMPRWYLLSKKTLTLYLADTLQQSKANPTSIFSPPQSFIFSGEKNLT